MSSILTFINIGLLLVLGFFAKDNLIQHAHSLFAKSSMGTLVPSSSIEVAFSPKGGATAAIIRALAESKKTILVSAYSFTSSDIAHALLAAKKRKVQVKIVLDKSQWTEKYSSAKFFSNQGFDIRIDSRHAIFHNKFMVIDGKTVITGSFNFTKAAEHRNAENVLIIRDNPKLAKLYMDNWWMHHDEAVDF